MALKDLPAALRPREKLLAHGPAALGDAELLALLLRTGIRGKGVLALADELLTAFHGFGGLLHALPQDFKAVKGLGPAKRAELGAVVEMSRRALAQQLRRGPVFDSPQAVKDYVALQLGGRVHEVFAVLFLDAHHRLIELRELFSGSVTQTSVYPREVLRQAMALNATAVILAHNHPSGVAEPSRADEFLTQQLKTALQMVDVRVLDHLVVGTGSVVFCRARPLVGSGAGVVGQNVGSMDMKVNGLSKPRGPGGAQPAPRRGQGARERPVASLKDLGALRDALHQAAVQAAEQRAREQADAARRLRERNAFAHAVGPVFPMRAPAKAAPTRPLPPPEPRQRELDEQAALREALSDEVDVESLLLTDDGLSFRRPDIGADVLVKLRRGHWAIQGQLDLHGLRRDEAREQLSDFIRAAQQRGERCLRVVHGKGHGSPGREPVLKAKVQRWLAQRREVIAFAQATGPQGGAGALIVLLANRIR